LLWPQQFGVGRKVLPMRMPLRAMCVCAAGCLLLIQPRVARADPIEISSGTVAAHVFSSIAGLNLEGPGFSFLGAVEGFLGNAAACSPCSSPVVDIGATLDPFSTGGGTGVIDGVSYSLVFIGFSSGTFSTGTATLTELGTSLVALPFTFSGVMNGYLEDPLIRPNDAPPIFTVSLFGQGTASARFFGQVDEDGQRSFSVDPGSVRYEFAPVITPEPGTGLLLGTALAALGVRRWRRRRS
jgi:hypothetical protein